MKILKGDEEKEALNYMARAAKLAERSLCLRAKCGSIIVQGREIIGSGYNSPPKNKKSQCRCSFNKENLHRKVTDKTCCIHAEQRAIISALKNSFEKLQNSRLYFIRLDEKKEMEKAGEPYCTICSKMALDVGVSEFVLFKKEGICLYNTEEYNSLSFNYKEDV